MPCVKSALISNPVFLTTLLVGIITWCSGCSIGYRSHHDSELLRLYRTSPVAVAANSEGHGHFEDGLVDSHQSVKSSESDRVSFVSEIEPAWAKEVLYVYEKDFEVALAQVAPVNVYIDHRPDSGEKSHFNRLTRSIVLKAGQAALPRIYLHELSHLFLNEIQSFPPYWIARSHRRRLGLVRSIHTLPFRSALARSPSPGEVAPPARTRRSRAG